MTVIPIPAVFAAIMGVIRNCVFFSGFDRLLSLKRTMAIPTAVPIRAPARASDVQAGILVDAGHPDQGGDAVGALLSSVRRSGRRRRRQRQRPG